MLGLAALLDAAVAGRARHVLPISLEQPREALSPRSVVMLRRQSSHQKVSCAHDSHNRNNRDCANVNVMIHCSPLRNLDDEHSASARVVEWTDV